MKEIQLTQGKVALVDDEDFEYLNQFKWFANKGTNIFYAYRWAPTVNNKRNLIYMHRVVRKLDDKSLFVDHKDLNGLNNQKENLRECTNSQNQRNKLSRGKSKYLGVIWHKKSNKWMAQISINRISKYLGIYNTENEAALAYNNKALEIAGEFARLNKI